MSNNRKLRDKVEGEEEGEEGARQGPLRMSDRKSGDANMFGDQMLQTCSVHLNKLNPDITRSVLGAVEPAEEKQSEPEDSQSTLSVIKGEESERKILQIVESTEFEEFDITTKLDILDTSKKKIEEIKRKSQEQIMGQIEQEQLDSSVEKSSKDASLSPTSTSTPSSSQASPGDIQCKSESETTSDPGPSQGSAPEIKEEIKAETEKEKVTDNKWKEGEKILCFHGPLIYEAKIQRVEIQNGIPKYFIHYRGWNKNWDEWVPEARMLKFCGRNVEIQKDLCSAHETKEKAKKMRQRAEHVFAVPKTPSPVPAKEEKGRRKAGCKPRRRADQNSQDFCIKNGQQISVKPPDNTVESEEQFRTKLEIKIKIPEELKPYIVDDWEQICGKRRLCVLPAKITAEQMISEYTRAKTANKADKLRNNKEKAILEVTAGVREYFNVMLSSQLLYKQERPQYEQLLKSEPGMVPCKTYGVVHLLRLFTKLGEILIYTPLSEKSISLLLFYINDMLMYMKRNASLLFSQADYSQEIVN